MLAIVESRIRGHAMTVGICTPAVIHDKLSRLRRLAAYLHRRMSRRA